VVLEKDMVFEANGDAIEADSDRSLGELSELQDGFIIWYEYVGKRVLGESKKKRKKKHKSSS